MTTRLFLFQIGPVQAFIAQARRTQDLFMGSHILSELVSAGVLASSQAAGFEAIFPLIKDGNVLGGAPNRFAFLCDDLPAEVAAAVQKAVQTRWLEGFADPVCRLVQRAVGDGDWQAVFERQSTQWMEFYWAAVDYDRNDHGGSFRRASAAVAQRKYVRTFHVLEEPGSKCTLTGMQSALPVNWKRLRESLDDADGKIIRANERLGSLALVKRLGTIALKHEKATVTDFEGFPATSEIAADQWGVYENAAVGKETTGYIAVLHMDGDQMGKRLNELPDVEEHQKFSRDLANYAEADGARKTLGQYGGLGRLVYSGGDDVLALLPLKNALQCADKLRTLFSQMTRCNASAGIAITPANLPLDRALELARQAEEMAKDRYDRNAVVVVEAHGTGQMRAAGAKWEVISFVTGLQELFEKHILSGKLGYDLQSIDHDLFGDSIRGAREAEIRRLVQRRIGEKAKDDEKKDVNNLTTTMIKLVEDERVVPSWSDMANWVILARFLAQGGKP